jgi:hypothetical protein
MGIVFTIIGFGALIGSPVGGASLLSGSLLILAAREVKRRKELESFWTKM